ncbi:class I SAM-dependent methyltransferase [Spiribacter pallidus]|jgi:SAM-dependent methyltransferase|uniref:Methyltransferase domain-containing protein n=1 Tax=Spiribacter pallidus TaxID=1987936 RepID=A0ABV3T9W9_9GAMM
MAWLNDWFKTPAGRELAQQESRLLSRRLAGLYARRVLQVGSYGEGCGPTVYDHTRQWIMDACPGEAITLRGNSQVMPLASGSVDGIVLVHQLEFTDKPHQVFREAARVLAPEGHMLVLCFNPLSLWGVRRWLSLRADAPPWNGTYLSAGRLMDWMRLLGVTPRPRESMAPLPPPLYGQRAGGQDNRRRDTRLPRIMRGLGGVNLIIGQKRVSGQVHPPAVRQRRLAIIPGGLAQAGARAAIRQERHDSG